MGPTTLRSKVEAIFYAALDLDPAAREALLQQECEGLPDLRLKVTRLLEHHFSESTECFILDRPPGAASSDADVDSTGVAPGDVVGRYRLLERIGEGGMGEVFMAEQVADVRRRVALKFIKLGMDTREVVARFEVERQALALFDHPNIARVLDAGVSPSGRSFFVMELVKGRTLREFVHFAKPDLQQRLELLIQMCNAVQHAHQKGIVHRDLKPSNVLITFLDGVPTPKIIDFGIAKALNHNLTDKTLFTRYSALMGTAEYMSPEQAEMSGLDIDTRSDIYSLGVLLYELITGTTPIAASAGRELNRLNLGSALREQEVAPPSTRLTQMETSNFAKQWTIGLVEVARRVRGDLDWVVMKAIARDRELRYSTAAELAADIQRFINGEAVLAAAPSRWYQIKSFYRRHRIALWISALATLLLVTSTTVCSLFAYHSWQAQIAQAETLRALSEKSLELEENNRRLVVAEKAVRRTLEIEQYDSAHLSAFSSHSRSLGPEYAKIERDVFEEMSRKEGREEAEDHFAIASDDMLLGDEIFFDPSGIRLFELQHAELVQPGLQRIQETISRRSGIYGQVELEQEQRSDKSSDEGPGETCCEYHQQIFERMEAIYKEKRSGFFRLLVDEYRATFGASDPRVADSLDMLAAVLIEDGQYNQAEAHLRESLILREIAAPREKLTDDDAASELVRTTEEASRNRDSNASVNIAAGVPDSSLERTQALLERAIAGK